MYFVVHGCRCGFIVLTRLKREKKDNVINGLSAFQDMEIQIVHLKTISKVVNTRSLSIQTSLVSLSCQQLVCDACSAYSSSFSPEIRDSFMADAFSK